MARVIPVSFKKDEDMLYREVTAHSGYSNFIKDCIKYYLKCINIQEQSPTELKESGDMDEINDILGGI